MDRFELVVVAIDAYEHHEDLPSTATAERIRRLLQPYGVSSVVRAEQTDAAGDLIEFLSDWATGEHGPGPTLLYWVGHGSREGPHAWLLAGQSRSPLTDAQAVNARVVGEMLRIRWRERTAGDGSWTVLVLDCCRGRDAATAVVNSLTTDPGGRPGQLAILEVGGNAATEVGRFADALDEALSSFTEHDEVIPLRTLLFTATDLLGGVVEPTIWLHRDAVISNPRAAPAGLITAQDLVEEWRAVIADLNPDARDHFLSKAQGTELGELGWHFEGRTDECRRLAEWLRDAESGMFVVTGEPGAGKSALLGRFVALADQAVADVLERTGLITDERALRPEPDAFDGVVHLAGRTLYDTQTAIEQAVSGITVGDAGITVEDPERQLTLLFDALDEAQAAEAIAYDLLRPLSRHPNVRVVVGTRRSLVEGPDLPAAPRPDLLEALAVSEDETLVLGREPPAMATYARRWLAAKASELDPELVDHVVQRIATVDQPFLFVQLALHELLARADDLDYATADTILAGGHGDVFAMAVDRLARQRPATAQLLRALAYAQGRGLPRHDGVWGAVARALNPNASFGERDIAQALVDGGRYTVLDGEHGQSVHRLAHRTFAERLLADDPDPESSHAAITETLLAGVTEAGWWQANSYLLAHLPRHAAATPARLEEVCTDVGWLAATLERFRVDELLSILDTIPPVARTEALAAVDGAVRRARVALAHDANQLAAQLHARLRDHDDPRIQTLIAQLPTVAPPVWLRVNKGGGEWAASGHVTMTFSAKIRALATGRLRGLPVILVGAGDTVASWNPARGTSEHVLDTSGERVTALAVDTIGGRDVVAVAAGYDGTVTVYPADGDQPLLRLTNIGCRQLAVGMLGSIPVVAICDYSGVRVVSFDGHEESVLSDANALAVGFEEATLVVLLEDLGDLHVRRIGGSARSDTLLAGARAATAHALVVIDQGAVAVVATNDAVEAWDARSGRHLGRVVVGPDFVVRTATAVVMNGSLAFAAGNDTDYEGGYVLVRSPGEHATTTAAHPLLRWAVAVAPGASLALVLNDDQAVLIDPEDSSSVPDEPNDLTRVFGPAAPVRSASGDLQLGPPGPAGRPERLSVHRPQDWPVDARAFGLLDGHPVVASAHVDGTCWLWSAETRDVVAGPFGVRRPEVLLPSQVAKGGPEPSSDVAYRQGARAAVLARVNEGRVTAWEVLTGEQLTITDIPGSEATAVALGVVDDQLLLASGAADGAISLWSVDEKCRLCGLTLDAGIRRLWFDSASPTLVALTSDGMFHIADVVT